MEKKRGKVLLVVVCPIAFIVAAVGGPAAVDAVVAFANASQQTVAAEVPLEPTPSAKAEAPEEPVAAPEEATEPPVSSVDETPKTDDAPKADEAPKVDEKRELPPVDERNYVAFDSESGMFTTLVRDGKTEFADSWSATDDIRLSYSSKEEFVASEVIGRYTAKPMSIDVLMQHAEKGTPFPISEYLG